jgi:hypothetical protein
VAWETLLTTLFVPNAELLEMIEKTSNLGKWLKCSLSAGVICLFLTILFWHFENDQLISLKVPSSTEGNCAIYLPLKDKKRLDYLFRNLVLQDDFAYTLLGNKPLSFGGYIKPFESSCFFTFYQSLLPSNVKMYLGWKTWLKYQHFFISSHYSLWAEESPWIKGGMIILLANKEALSLMISNHEQDFLHVLERGSVCSEELLTESNEAPLFQKILKAHDGLIGTLLGYGRNNAWLFYEKDDKRNALVSSLWVPEVERIMINQMGWSSLLFSKKGSSLSEELFFPAFKADDTSLESELLKSEYELTRNKTIQYYEGKSFLEATLALLKHGPSQKF